MIASIFLLPVFLRSGDVCLGRNCSFSIYQTTMVTIVKIADVVMMVMVIMMVVMVMTVVVII